MTEYEFWEEEAEYYKKFFSRMYQDDLQRIWETIAEKAKGDWLWVVYCKETKQVLSWLISKGRFFKHAKAVLLKAKQAAGGRPQLAIMDGLYQYDAAIKK